MLKMTANLCSLQRENNDKKIPFFLNNKMNTSMYRKILILLLKTELVLQANYGVDVCVGHTIVTGCLLAMAAAWQ